jgi:phosphomethylpyrimidine synthase
VTAALSAEQQEILEKRGVLSPDEIHRLATKTKKVVASNGQKASCHSDVASADQAKAIQETLVESVAK